MPTINRYSLPLIVLSTLLNGCHTPEPSLPTSVGLPSDTQASERYIPVQRYGRYTLVELEQVYTQQNLLQQIIDVDLPSTWLHTVGDALPYVLLRSGYRLCERSDENAPLLEFPLPASHLKLGPMPLRDALQLLAGPGWSLQANEQLRTVCFIPATSTYSDPFPRTSSALEATQ